MTLSVKTPLPNNCLRTQTPKPPLFICISLPQESLQHEEHRAVADPGFSRGRAPTPKMGVLPYYFANLLPKTA